MEEKLTLSRKDVAGIIAQWWAEYAANPEAFRPDPDAAGEDSAATFFRIAGELGVGH